MIETGEPDIGKSFVAVALDRLGVEYSGRDTTSSFIDFWRRVKQALDELQDEFIAEGNEFIYKSLNEEAENEFLPAIETGKLHRYLYQVLV